MQRVSFSRFSTSFLPWFQAGLMIAAWASVDWLCRRYALPVPSGILALLLLLAGLTTGILRGEWLRPGAGRLLSHMLLFFVPVLMVPLAHPELFGVLGLKILLIIAVSTAAVMLSTGLVIEACFRRSSHE